MPIPWLRLLNTAVGVADFALARRASNQSAETRSLVRRSGALGRLETRLAGVVVSALREVFERDSRRLEFEREQAELQRQRAERALRLELVRQAGERELGRLRLLAGIAVVSWLSTLFLWSRVADAAVAGRILMGVGWVALLGALVAALQGMAAVGKTLTQMTRLADPDPEAVSVAPGGGAATWLIVAGLVLACLALLVA